MGSVGQVFADSCLVCSQQCFIQTIPTAIENKQAAARRKHPNGLSLSSLEVRRTLYKAFEVGLTPEDVIASPKGDIHELPLCGPCLFKVGQLRSIQSQLNFLERQYEKIREEIAFSIVDIVANSHVTNEVCTNILSLPPNSILKKFREYEVGTLQQLVFEKWHETSDSDFDTFEEELIQPPERSISVSVVQNGESSRSQQPKSTKQGFANNGSNIEKPCSVSITKVESQATPQQQKVQQRSQSFELEKIEDNTQVGPDDELMDGFMIDEEYEVDESQDPLGYPFSLELAEYSSSIQNGHDTTMLKYEETEEYEEGSSGSTERFSGSGNAETQQNLEVFRDKDGLYECEFCQKKFIHKYPFRDHLRVHLGDGPRCKICNKIFPKKHNLMLHLRTHSGEKPYVCSVCNKGFADKSNLKVHMRVHTGERPYKCDFCSVAFSNSSRLVVHKRTHTGEKPFTCDICNRKCTTRNQLSTHRKTHFQSGRNRVPILQN